MMPKAYFNIIFYSSQHKYKYIVNENFTFKIAYLCPVSILFILLSLLFAPACVLCDTCYADSTFTNTVWLLFNTLFLQHEKYYPQ